MRRIGDLKSTDQDTDQKNDQGTGRDQGSLDIDRAMRTGPGKSTEKGLPQLPVEGTGKALFPRRKKNDAAGLEK